VADYHEHEDHDHRHLQLATAECFKQCVVQQMTAASCERYIYQILGSDLSEHVVSNLEIVISAPRPPSVMANSYFLVGIPTNVQGQMKCDMFRGEVNYRKIWSTAQGDFAIPPVNCVGLSADACCDKFHATLATNNIPDTDVQGNCLTCWTHQEPLEPVITGTGELVYNHPHALSEGGECVVGEITRDTVQAIDAGVENALENYNTEITGILGRGRASCAELGGLQRNLQVWARSKSRSMAKIANLLCGICDSREDVTTFTLTAYTIFTLEYIQKFIVGEVNSDVSQIVIYTDHQGFVMDPPTLGGNREELGVDHDDPECEDPLPEEEPMFFSDGTEIPTDTGICDALAMSEQGGLGEPCNQCRKCLTEKCEWEDDSFCKGLMEGQHTGTSEEWLVCLESQGISDVLEPGTEDKGFDNWCHCALKCERECLKEDFTEKKRDRECNAVDMSKRSDEDEQCHDCRVCLQEECTETGEWNPKHWCSFLVRGARNGTPDQWLACLETDGASKVYTGDGVFEDEFLGKRDTWGACAHKCDASCYKQRVVPAPTTGPICMYEELAGHSGIGEFCQGCRTCMMRTCGYWADSCQDILTGELVGTPDNWNWCLNNCGGGLDVSGGARNLRSGEERHLNNDDGLGTPRSTWCECARSCDDSCHYPESVPML
jgi:hypothetical protein